LTAKAKKLLSILLKLAILLLAFYGVYRKTQEKNDDIHKFIKLVSDIPVQNVVITLAFILLLMLLNYLLESLKWWHLARELSPISVWEAVESVFCGLTWAVFTPNRIGEYGGRVMFLQPRKRIHGVFAMAVGSFGQNVITNVLGASAGVWFLYSYLHLNQWFMLGIDVLAAIFIATMLTFYFNIKWMVSLLNRVKFLEKYHRFFDIMGKYNFRELLNIMWFCLARFFVFTFQYYLIIHLLIPQMPLITMALLMFVFFFLQSAIPSWDIIDIAIRSHIAIFLFGFVTDKTISVVVSVSLIYITNLVMPAILGSVFVLKLKFFDRNN